TLLLLAFMTLLGLSSADAKAAVAVVRGSLELRRKPADRDAATSQIDGLEIARVVGAVQAGISRTEMVSLWADAIARMEGTRELGGSYRNNNPGNLRGWSSQLPKDDRG